MSKSPAALSGPLLFKRQKQSPEEASQYKTTIQRAPQRDGRTTTKRSFFRSGQLNKDKKQP